jgi:cytosine/adenosine deaminase-related metal-dependent hydrolase
MNKAMTQQTAYENQAQMADLQAQMQAMQAQQAAAAMTPPVSTSPDVMTQLQQLASMKAQGLLTDVQFEAAKSKLLGI